MPIPMPGGTSRPGFPEIPTTDQFIDNMQQGINEADLPSAPNIQVIGQACIDIMKGISAGLGFGQIPWPNMPNPPARPIRPPNLPAVPQVPKLSKPLTIPFSLR